MKFYNNWEIADSTDTSHMLEQKNCPKGSHEICRDFRILAAEKQPDGTWQLYRGLDDGRGIHSVRELEIVSGTKNDAIHELQKYKD